jgi:hypothetical protein
MLCIKACCAGAAIHWFTEGNLSCTSYACAVCVCLRFGGVGDHVCIMYNMACMYAVSGLECILHVYQPMGLAKLVNYSWCFLSVAAVRLHNTFVSVPPLNCMRCICIRTFTVMALLKCPADWAQLGWRCTVSSSSSCWCRLQRQLDASYLKYQVFRMVWFHPQQRIACGFVSMLKPHQVVIQHLL